MYVHVFVNRQFVVSFQELFTDYSEILFNTIIFHVKPHSNINDSKDSCTGILLTLCMHTNIMKNTHLYSCGDFFGSVSGVHLPELDRA